jgi:hypothetical protein
MADGSQATSPALNAPLRSEAQAISELGRGLSPYDLVKQYKPEVERLGKYLGATVRTMDDFCWEALNDAHEHLAAFVHRLEEHIEVEEEDRRKRGDY